MFGKALDRRHLAVTDGVDERDAGENRHPVELDRAGTAVPLAAGDLGAGQAEVEQQRFGERPSDGRIELVGMAVDRELEHLRTQLCRRRLCLGHSFAPRSLALDGRARLGCHREDVRQVDQPKRHPADDALIRLLVYLGDQPPELAGRDQQLLDPLARPAAGWVWTSCVAGWQPPTPQVLWGDSMRWTINRMSIK